MAIAGTAGVTFPDGTVQTTAATGGFAASTVMLFVQTAAPTGWTKSTTHDNKALRIVSGSAGTGGSVAFTTAFAASLSAGATTLSTSQIPSHNHDVRADAGTINGTTQPVATLACANSNIRTLTGNAGGGGSHTHTLPSFAVSYVDVIIATKD
jgi:hypothetical protein